MLLIVLGPLVIDIALLYHCNLYVIGVYISAQCLPLAYAVLFDHPLARGTQTPRAVCP